nr:glycosyltransferase family 4 protein [Shewanella algae]
MVGVKTVCTIHDGVLHAGDGKPLEQFLNRLYVKNACKLVFLTDYVRKLVKDEIGYNCPVRVIPHGIIGNDHEFYQDCKFEKKSLLFFGRVSQYKGVENLLAAVKLIPTDYFETIYIVGKSQYQVDYELAVEYSHKLEVIDRFVDESEVGDIFNRSSILVLPYVEATQSGVAMLGVKSKTPMIISNCGGLKEQLGNESALYYEPDDINALSECIMRLLNDRELYRSLRSSLIRKESCLSWEYIAHCLEEFISEE